MVTPSAAVVDVLTTSVPPLPTNRYVPFASLSPDLQSQLVSVLRYNQRKWDKPGKNNVEEILYSDLCRKTSGIDGNNCEALDIIEVLGFNSPDAWDCW